jgi:hypothetical protein
VKAIEQRTIVHGVRKGHTLSERMLVESYADLRAGNIPSRPYVRIGEQRDTSLAAAIIIDQSGSMGWGPDDEETIGPQKLEEATRCMMAIIEPLDGLGCATFAAGFRDGAQGFIAMEDRTEIRSYHRVHGVHHDVFKGFNERFAQVAWRFANTRAENGTPMADGVQFGLDALSKRTEAHRILFIITDGEPDWGHKGVIRRQIRIASEAGVQVLGVGIGEGSVYVQSVFPDFVFAETIQEMPFLLQQKLNEILDQRGLYRGRQIRSTG